eukprot:10245063-Lingulodinium_polyedra.AAC.1
MAYANFRQACVNSLDGNLDSSCEGCGVTLCHLAWGSVWGSASWDWCALQDVEKAYDSVRSAALASVLAK